MDSYKLGVWPCQRFHVEIEERLNSLVVTFLVKRLGHKDIRMWLNMAGQEWGM